MTRPQRASPPRRLTVATLYLLLAPIAFTGCAPGGPIDLHGSAMGTTWTVTLADVRSEADIARAEHAIEGVLAEADATLSVWNARSEVSALNAHQGGDWFPVSAPLYAVIEAALRVSERTGGAFDVTSAPLVALWGFGANASTAVAPSDAAISAARSLVGPEMLELRADPRAIRKRIPGVRLDLDAIAPGYAVDRISSELIALGLDDHVVEIGGEVRCAGRGPGGRRWRIAVERPQADTRTVQSLVALEDRGISTSGDYRDFRAVNGSRISHTIDPRSGRPVSHALASVSVVHESVMLADAYATGLMVLGAEDGYKLAERLDLPVLLIVRTSGGLTLRVTPSFERLRVRDPGLLSGAQN